MATVRSLSVMSFAWLLVLGPCLPCPFWGKASNFRGLFESLLCYVATINIAYIEIFS